MIVLTAKEAHTISEQSHRIQETYVALRSKIYERISKWAEAGFYETSMSEKDGPIDLLTRLKWQLIAEGYHIDEFSDFIGNHFYYIVSIYW